MKSNKTNFLLGFALIMVLATACTSDTGTKTSISSGAFIGGTEGLKLEFLSGAPPDSVFDTNNPFSINLKVENVGEWDVPKEKVRVTIAGMNPNDFGKTTADLSKNSPDDLAAAKKDPNGNKIQGTITNVDYEGLQYAGKVNGEVQFNVKAEACYEYGTKAQTQLCISKDFLGRTGEEGVCKPNEDKSVENSGAPVQISKLTQSVLGNNKVSFQFDVKHSGKGNVYTKGSSCNTELANRNKVFVTVTDPGLGTLTCSGLEGGTTSGSVILYEGSRSIRCTLDVAADKLSDYEKVLNVQVEYDYKDTVEKSMTVKQGQV